MEKFRHFGDAATGVHPFTYVISPTPLGRIGATVVFPVRLVLSAFFVLLLLFTDTLLWLLHCSYLGLLGKLIIAPLQRVWIRGLLFFIGHIIPDAPTAIAYPSNNSSNAKLNKRPVMPRQVSPGDLIVCNLQSVWDGPVFEVMLAQPYHAICFPDATATDAATPGLRVFWPGPLQRWQVWNFVRRTGRLDFLKAQQPGGAAQQALAKKSDEAALQLYLVQNAAAQARVPVWWFGEGTCSNGKGLLPMPQVICCSAALTAVSTTTNGKAASECAVYLATIQYDSPALQNVLGSDVEGLWGLLFRTSSLLYGSTAPAWSSPFFPTAELTFSPARLLRAAAVVISESSGADNHKTTNAKAPAVVATAAGTKTYWMLTTPALLELRHAMCQRGQALVVSGGGGGGVAVRRQPLSVGIKEKTGFVEAYIAMLRKA